MKTCFLIIALFLISGSAAKSQNTLNGIPYNEEQQKFVYDTVITVTGIDAETIFVRGREWLSMNFKDSRMLYINEDESRLAMAAFSPIRYRAWFLFFFNTKNFNLLNTIQFQARDNRYRIIISDFIIQEPVDGKIRGANWAAYDDFAISSYRVRPASKKDHPAETFFKSRYRRSNRTIAFNEFKEINNSFLDEFEKGIRTPSTRDDW